MHEAKQFLTTNSQKLLNPYPPLYFQGASVDPMHQRLRTLSPGIPMIYREAVGQVPVTIRIGLTGDNKIYLVASQGPETVAGRTVGTLVSVMWM